MPRLTGILPYLAWQEDVRLFALDQGGFGEREEHAIGFCIETLPQTGASDEMEKVLASLFVSCPPGTGIQISLYGSPHILPLLRAQANLLPSSGGGGEPGLARSDVTGTSSDSWPAVASTLPEGHGPVDLRSPDLSAAGFPCGDCDHLAARSRICRQMSMRRCVFGKAFTPRSSRPICRGTIGGRTIC
jgi:hypothetical protein